MSATALLQKAAQMGVTMSKPTASTNTAIVMSQHQQQQSILSGSHQQDHMCAPTLLTAHHQDSGLGNLSSCDDDGHQGISGGFGLDPMGATTTAMPLHAHSHLLNTFQETYNGAMGANKRVPSTSFQEVLFPAGGGGRNDELTRDFLGLTGFPSSTTDHHFLSMAGLGPISTSLPYHHHHQQQLNSNQNQNQNQIPWEG